MDVTFGSIADTAPDGFLSRRLHFSNLVELDTPTKEGLLSRLIASSGFGTRDLPLAITGLGPDRGHHDAALVGRLDAIRVGSDLKVEAWGWLVADDNGLQAFKELQLGLVDHTSIEMVDVRLKVELVWGEPDADGFADVEGILATFTESNVGATTLVMKPAFANTKVELEGEELTAALALEDDLEVTAAWTVDWAAVERDVLGEELTAADRACLPREAFTVPEPDCHQTLQVSRDGRFVSGHLGRWGECHTGIIDRCVNIPRSRSNYASFCKSAQPLDDGGTVYTGPLLLVGGHRATTEAINAALEDPASAWADVVVYDGKFGPWMCGVVRPHVTDAGLIIGRGSRVSGHWKKGELYAVCSTNAEGFDVSRTTEFFLEDGELVASFAVEDCGCEDEGIEDVDYGEAALALAATVMEDA